MPGKVSTCIPRTLIRTQRLAYEKTGIRIRQTSASALTHIPRERTASLPPLTEF